MLKYLRSFRLFNIALFDFLSTVLVAILIEIFKNTYKIQSYTNSNVINIFITLLLLMIIGIIVHFIFNIKTTINNALFGN